MSDKIHRFLFDKQGIRGEMVQLESSVQAMLKNHNYPTVIAELLQQAAAVSILLTTTLKFEGRLSVQLQSEGMLKLLVVQCNHRLGFRGTARYDEQQDYSNISFEQLTNKGRLAIMIEPKNGRAYQGYVELNQSSFARSIEVYFSRSEQLKTRIWLFSNNKRVTGLMLQALPKMPSDDEFNHLVCLSETLSKQESLSEDADTLLNRLFHQEDINNLMVQDIDFECSCSRKKMLDSVSLLTAEEIRDVFLSKSTLEVNCNFCGSHFEFKEVDIKSHHALTGNKTKH